MSNTKRIVIACFFLTTFGILSACGTVNGFGRDVSTTGHTIQKIAH
ncbi:MAG: entericidin A [Legionellales bacterium]